MKVLVFDIWGDYAHYRKFYTTSSPLTFSCPTPTAVYGMLGAILGTKGYKHLEIFNYSTTKLGIQILKPITKVRMSTNYVLAKEINDLWYLKDRTPIQVEYLKNPSFRLFIHINNNEIFTNLINKIQNKLLYYTVSLGTANLIANYKYIGVFKAEHINHTDTIKTIIPLENIENIKAVSGKKYFKETLPVDMSTDRQVKLYKEILMELNGAALEGEFKECYKLDNGDIISFI
ncbi:CRISPR-associated protein Cas5 (plasmid) [Deferribacter desulfuricans SSM1]|uniref:CRISPR-associated protein Cas5 n=1 Tax=Deferribacter desulfuricans (strain DSM 14783 / JCM 11476 / NBRC 101012 / SSM1) TaxID=639282 RepID=D3PEQ1_DEFDS|nr:type I-B CRISPR-associated protein Cas5b [Deferribacter desulfuricans]BAI81693.1 CRISPR-associated protein Cas5 [Deferribacter desulfuricans SSM1]